MRAFQHFEAFALEEADQPPNIIAAKMHQLSIVLVVQTWSAGDLDDSDPPRPENPETVRHGAIVALNVLEDVQRHQAIRKSVWQGTI